MIYHPLFRKEQMGGTAKTGLQYGEKNEQN